MEAGLMTKREIERTVQGSLLDRLTDHEPKSNVEGRIGYLESVRQYKTGLQRDLEWLLNTRRIPVAPPEELAELQHSVYTYGLPDLTSISRDSPEARDRLLRRVEDAIATFEPRLANVNIMMAEMEGEQHRRELRFHVEGTLLMDPTPEQVVFDTVLHFASGEYQVEGAGGGAAAGAIRGA
jgi:type VI secretion system protein ImpF